MTVLEFIASLAESLAWPTATLIAVFWLRNPITNALEKRLRRAKLGSAEFEFDPEKTEEFRALVEGERAELERSSLLPSEAERQPVPRTNEDPDRATKLAELAGLSPVGAFLTSFIELERTLRELLADRDEALRAPLGQLGRAALRHDLFSEADYSAFEYLRHARNELVHATPGDLTPAQGVELASLADSLTRTALVRAFMGMRG